jgi:hypothetical protein
MAVVVSNTPVGTAGETDRSRQSTERPNRTEAIALAKSLVAETAGEMALQAPDGHHGTECAAQELVQLIGYRDPTARPKSWRDARRRSAR